MTKKRKPIPIVRKKAEAKPIRLDFGCGKNPAEGFEGVDSIDFGQKHLLDLSALKSGVEAWRAQGPANADCLTIFKPWPWADSSVEEARAIHFVEHLSPKERVHFVNELFRVLRPGGKCLIVVPHWASARAYGDLTHQWPPMSEFWLNYLSKPWRDSQAPHNSFYTCDFDTGGGFNVHPEIALKAQPQQEYAMRFYKEAAQDMFSTLTATRKTG